MIFGYYNYISNILNSTFCSLILYFGCCFLGYFIIRLKIFYGIKLNKSFYLHSPLIFLNILILILFPLANLNILNYTVFNYISKFIFLSGIVSIFFFYIKFKYIIVKKYKLLMFLFFIFVLLSLTPITHADSLAYHLNTAVYLLNHGTFVNQILPIESQLSGAGEILIALGLSIGAEQFSSLTQVSAVLSIISIFFNVKQKFISEKNYYLLVSVLTTPLFFFFISSPKPQILPIVNVCWVFSIVYIFFKNFNSRELVRYYIFTSLLLTLNFITKFSFILSSAILFFYSSYFLYKKKLYLQIFLIPITIFLIFIFPSILFKYIHFNLNIFQFFLGPLPINIFGYHDFINSIKQPITFPEGIVFPPRITDISAIIGPAFLTFCLIKASDLKNKKLFFLIIFAYILITFIYATSSARFIFDSFLILQFILIFCKFYSKLTFYYFKKFVLAQFIISCLIVSYFIIILLPGSFSESSYKKVMSQSANGYDLITWANKFLKKEDKIISTHRSISLFNVESFEYHTLEVIDFSNTKSIIYLDFIKSNKFNKILFYNNNQNQNIFKNCIGKLIAVQENVGRHVGRNLLSKGNYYNGELYELRYDLLPNCVIDR